MYKIFSLNIKEIPVGCVFKLCQPPCADFIFIAMDFRQDIALKFIVFKEPKNVYVHYIISTDYIGHVIRVARQIGKETAVEKRKRLKNKVRRTSRN